MTEETKSAEHEFQILSNSWAQYGPEYFLTKLRKGRGWITDTTLFNIPTVFKTKRAATDAVDVLVLERSRRRREERGTA